MGFNLMRGCSLFSNVRPWLKSSTSQMMVHWDQLPIKILIGMADAPLRSKLPIFGFYDMRDLQLFLYDPISRAQLPLPPLSTISHFEDSFGDKVSGWNPAACIIAQVDASSSDASQCIVVATFVTNSSISALCRPNGERWTIVEGLLADGFYYGNFFFFDEELYGYRLSIEPDRVNNINEAPDFQTHSITLGSQGDRENLKLICNTPPPTWLLYAEDADGLTKYQKDCLGWPYFMESNGQLLMVTAIRDCISSWHEQEVFEAAIFQVFKIQTATMCITRITDLGNQSLFLGTGAAENPDKYDKNCIYFLQYMDYSYENEYPLVCREAVIYYVNDGSIKRCIPSIKTENLCLFMRWFSPLSILEYLISNFYPVSRLYLALLFKSTFDPKVLLKSKGQKQFKSFFEKYFST
ncbi:hypothetical protein CXB51_012250 [Gossypium anomalum]|uniref:KIB1-4 beta-propeller domain-containing protein n=1 Tax=Gossypium anomalum TaxID=47600 RepID=A0A8J5YQG5_9ROSI|nr:hypothetical protein CXB51_012250 [Gossypium anomalum]